jgi:hypothetical protein
MHEKPTHAHIQKWDMSRFTRDGHERTNYPNINTMQACESACPSVILAQINGVLLHHLLNTGSYVYA